MPDFNLKEESEFIQACVEGDVDKLQVLFDKNPGLVNVPASNGSFPLMFAAEQGHVSAVQWLLDHGALKDNTVAEDGLYPGATALLFAGSNDKWEVVSTLLKADVKCLDYITKSGVNKGCTVLLYAAIKQEWDIVLELLKKGAKNLDSTLEVGPNAGLTALFLASLFRRWDIVSELLNKGAKNLDTVLGEIPECAEYEHNLCIGTTILLQAARFEQWEIVLSLIEKGVKNLDAVTIKYGLPALYCATQHDRGDIALALLKAGAKNLDATSQAYPSITALYHAAERGNVKLVQTLLAHGASIDIGPPFPLQRLKIVLNANLRADNFNMIKKLSETAIILKAAEDLFTFAENKTGTLEELNNLLTILGHSINAVKKNKTVLKVAIENQHPLLVPLLIAKGANRLDKEENCLFIEGEFVLPEIALNFDQKQMINAFAKLEWVKSLIDRYEPIEIPKSSAEIKEEFDFPVEENMAENIAKGSSPNQKPLSL